MRAMIWRGSVLALLLSAAGCAAPQRASLEQLRTRSAFDLGCHPQTLYLYHLDERTKGVVGCGRRLTYVESCEALGSRDVCTWTLDQPPGQAPVGVSPVPAYAQPAPRRRPTPPTLPAPAPADADRRGELIDPFGAPASRIAPPPAPASSVRPLDPFEDRH